MSHTLVFHDGAETLDTIRAHSLAGAAPVIGVDLSIVSYSRASYKFQAADATLLYKVAGQLTSGLWDTGTTRDFVWTSFHFYMAAMTNNTNIWVVDDGGTIRGYATILTTGAAVIGGIGTASSGAGLITTGVWYVASCLYNRNGNNRLIIRNRESGATILDITTAAANSAIINNRVGHNGVAVPDLRVDNIVFESSNTLANVDDPVNLLGVRYACGFAVARADGYYNDPDWSGSYVNVDEIPNDGDTTYRSNSVISSGAFTVACMSSSSFAAQIAEIKAVTAVTVIRTTASSGQVQQRLRSGSVDSNGINALGGTSYGPCQRLFTTDPATASPWAVSGFDSAQVGLDRTINAGEARCTLVGLEALYVVGDITRTKVIAYLIDEQDTEQRIFDAVTGEELPYEEIQPNVGWMRVTSGNMPDSSAPADAWEDETLLPIDSVRFTQDASGVSLDIVPSSESLAEQLIRGLANSSGGL